MSRPAQSGGPVEGSRNLSMTVRGVLRRAVDVYRDQPRTAQQLRHQLDRLDEPLRVAIAGKVKAGKSTLLNALVGELIAPTDAGECTRVVTWYLDGHSPKILMDPKSGGPEGRGACHRSAGHLGRCAEPAGGALALAKPAGHHLDRHTGDRVDVHRHLSSYRQLSHSGG